MALNYNPPTNDKGDPFIQRWMASSGRLLNALVSSGTTANRPTVFIFNGRTYFDTSLGIPIWYAETGTKWINAAGVTV
jgi:hypothetical protein